MSRQDHRHRPALRRRLGPLLLAWLAGCGGRAADLDTWAGTVDTLPDGIVQVSNPATGLWDSARAWRVEQDLRIGRAEGDAGPDLFGNIMALAVDPAGRIYVLEHQAQEIRVFGPDGRHVRTLGRKGGGPGEFQDARSLAWDRNGNLWVVDQRNNRYTIYDSAGVLLRTLPRPATGVRRNWAGGFDSAGRLHDIGTVFERVESRPGYQAASGPREVLYRLDSTGTVTDTFPVPRYEGEWFDGVGTQGTTTMRFRVPVPFTGQLAWIFDPRGFFVAGITDRYRIAWLGLDGDTARVIEQDYNYVPVTDAQATAAIEDLARFPGMRGNVDRSRLGRHHPAFHYFALDTGGHLWVRVLLPPERRPSDGTAFDVFDPEGRYLGLVVTDVPVSPPFVIEDDRFYGVTRDEFDIPYVVRAHIVKP